MACIKNKDGNFAMSHSDVVKVRGGRTLTMELSSMKDLLDETAHGNMITSEANSPIINSTTKGTVWGTSGLNYNTSSQFCGLDCVGVRIVGVDSDVEIGKINLDTKDTTAIVTVAASDMEAGQFLDVIFDDVQLLSSRETLYLRGYVRWIYYTGASCMLAVNKSHSGVAAWVVPIVKVPESTNILSEVLDSSRKLASGTLGSLNTAATTNFPEWRGFDDLRVTANSIITKFRYTLASQQHSVKIKVVTLNNSNVVTAIRDYVFTDLENRNEVSVYIPVTPNDVILCNGVGTVQGGVKKPYWVNNVEIGGTLSYGRNETVISLEWDYVADTETNRIIFSCNEKVDFPNKHLKLAILGDSIMANSESGTGRYINAKLGTTLLKTSENPDFGVLALGWATLVDWVKDGVNISTPTLGAINSKNGNALNCITNQVRKLLQHTTALGEQISWKHPTEGDTYTIDTSVGTGAGYTDDVPDIIFIAAGTNDWNADDASYDKRTKYNAETGTDDFDTVIGQSYSELDRGTFSSCIRWIVETLKINYPNAHIIFGNVMHATSRTSWTTAKQRSKLIEDICGWEGIPVIDTLHQSGLGGGTLGWLTNEGLHPNATGRELLASFIAGQIKSLVGELQ